MQLEAAMKARRYDAARGLLEEARLLDSTHPALEAWRRASSRVAADTVAERERQEREAEAARVEAERKAAAKAEAERARREAGTKLAGCKTAIDAKRYSEARQLVTAARAIDPTHPNSQLAASDRRSRRGRRGQERKKREEAENQARQDSDLKGSGASGSYRHTGVGEGSRQGEALSICAGTARSRAASRSHSPGTRGVGEEDRPAGPLAQPASSGWKKQVGVAAVLALTATVGTLVYQLRLG